MAAIDSRKDTIDDSNFWYIILPILIISLLLFFVYVLFHVSSIHLIGTEQVFQLVSNYKNRV
uniref:Uncharacterized protein n=1 Tax=viral metagenome TaxID=1070528 RepID=A0A6C0D7L8_9ZZZZ